MTARRLVAEALGTALLLVVIVGSGITVQDEGTAALQLFTHAVVVGAALAALIAAFGSVSGAHFNPLVTAADAVFGGIGRRLALAYALAQTAGAVVGVLVANAMFSLPAVTVSVTDRTGPALVASEAVATFGLLLVVFGVVRSGRPSAVPAAVGAWIAAAIYATSSASFANPAVTIARQLSDTYTGIAPDGVAGFLAGQLVGAAAAVVTVRWLFRPPPRSAADVVVPRADDAIDAIDAETGAAR